MIRLSTMIAAAAVVAAATPAPAQDLGRPAVTRSSASIDLSRFDLSTAAGADALIARVESTALRLCGGGAAAGVLAPQAAMHAAECRRNAVTTALAKVDAPVVQQRYAARHEREIRLAGR